jgi:hypothetical protein
MGRASPYVTRAELEAWISEPEIHMAIVGAEFDGQYSLSVTDVPADPALNVPQFCLKVPEEVTQPFPKLIEVHDREVSILVERDFGKVAPLIGS